MFENLLAFFLFISIYFLWNQIFMICETPREYIYIYMRSRRCVEGQECEKHKEILELKFDIKLK